MPPYPRKLINEGENVVLDLKPHWIFFWKHIVVGIVFLVVFTIYVGPADGSSIIGWPLGSGCSSSSVSSWRSTWSGRTRTSC
jgi:hypothetical protein